MNGTLTCWRNAGRAMKLATPLIALTLSGCGQLYFHDGTMEKLSIDAQTGFQGIIDKNLAGQLADQVKLDQEFAVGILQSLGDVSNSTQLNTLTDLTWTMLLAKAGTELGKADTQLSAADTGLKAADEGLIKAVEEYTTAKKGTLNAAAALNEAECYQHKYTETQNLLAEMIAIDFSQPAAGLSQSFAGLLSAEVKQPFAEKTETTCAGAKTVAQLLGLDDALVLAKAGAGTDRSEILNRVFDLATGKAALTKKATLALRDPGLAATVLGLGYDLARATELRLKAEVAYWTQAKTAYQRQKAFANDWKSDLNRHVNTGKDFSIKALVDEKTQKEKIEKEKTKNEKTKNEKTKKDPMFADRRVGETLKEMAAAYLKTRQDLLRADDATRTDLSEANDEAREGLVYALITLAEAHDLVHVKARTADTLAAASGALATARQAALAEAILKEREAVIARGLEGLVGFHKGGITAADMQSIIGLAQFVGLLVIAEGV